MKTSFKVISATAIAAVLVSLPALSSADTTSSLPSTKHVAKTVDPVKAAAREAAHAAKKAERVAARKAAHAAKKAERVAARKAAHAAAAPKTTPKP